MILKSATALSLMAFLLALPAGHALAAQEGDAPSGLRLGDSLSLSGTLAVTTDYVFRGITQNDEHPAAQLGLQLAHDSGVYASLWGSPVDFNDGNEARAEVDAALGYAFENGPWSADVHYMHYFYPGAAKSLEYNYGEFVAGGGYDFGPAALGLSLAFSPDYFGGTGHAEYVQTTLNVPLPRDFSAHGSLGRQYVEDNTKLGLPDTTDWALGVTYTYKSLDFDVSYADTDLSKSECPDGCSGRVIGTVTYNF